MSVLNAISNLRVHVLPHGTANPMFSNTEFVIRTLPDVPFIPMAVDPTADESRERSIVKAKSLFVVIGPNTVASTPSTTKSQFKPPHVPVSVRVMSSNRAKLRGAGVGDPHESRPINVPFRSDTFAPMATANVASPAELTTVAPVATIAIGIVEGTSAINASL
jgi:hypothetical protein